MTNNLANIVTLEQIVPCIEALIGAGNLNKNQAKTLVYYAAMTQSDVPTIRPIVELNGESGTGKNSIMKQLKEWCRDSEWINARNITPATLRDNLADTVTAFVEEADKTTDSKEAENWYQNRYEETGKIISYRRQTLNKKGNSIYKEEIHNHFGYTILHTQNPFQSTEMDRRVLRITIFKIDNPHYKVTENEEISIPLIELGLSVDWNKDLEGTFGGSAWDVWLPLIRVADYLGDSDFLEYAREQIKSKTEEDDLSKMFEPKGIVLSEIAPLYEDFLKFGTAKIPVTAIRSKVKERDCLFNERQIVKLARDLGFTMVYPKNKAHIKVMSTQELQEIFEKSGSNKNFENDSNEK
ncbi:hypothetical protein ACFLTP_01760 [Chloroflexota bacterium]